MNDHVVLCRLNETHRECQVLTPRSQCEGLPLGHIRRRDRLQSQAIEVRSDQSCFQGEEVRNPYTVVVSLRSVADEPGDLRHSLDSDDTLDGEVGLVRKAACEVVRAELQLWDEGVRDQKLRPLVEKVILYNGDVERQ